jgi:hypothetical protein
MKAVEIASFQIVPLIVDDVTSPKCWYDYPCDIAQRLNVDTAESIERGAWASLGPTQPVAVSPGLLIEAERLAGFKARRRSL